MEFIASLQTLLSLHDTVVLSQNFCEERARGQDIFCSCAVSRKESERCKPVLSIFIDLFYVFLEIFFVFAMRRDTSDNKKVHYATDLSSHAARQNFPWQKNLKLMQTVHLRNFD